ncbi:EAL domain-containing protein [Planktotalea arctica]|uniref:EAL domain-containing protein n=1 Tax=Planktotalea arctica TaxID=1481893 RepID=UPI000A172F03|nr:EAL domain-containing protein [Planktotalea arctica]
MAQRRKRNRLDPYSNGDPLSAAVNKRDRSVMDMVRAALEHKQVMLAYQPIMQSAGGVAFHEGLIRVLDETGRIIPAREFINVIEETEMGRIVDCLALEKGMRALRRNPNLRLSINMSARSIGYGRWKQVLDRNLRTDPTLGERLILEITESSAMLVPELVISFMDELQTRGVCFALDDFGSGYTSFRYLRDFYFDMIKIDGQFVRGVSSNPDNQVLVRALVSIAQHFDMFTVAEFVENAEDANFLAQNGVDCLQGYYYGAPTVRPPWEAEEEKLQASA